MMSDYMKKVSLERRRCDIEFDEEWEKWREKIPFLELKEGWLIKVIPPFMGAIARFHISKNDKYVSVYLDCYDRIGTYGKPYWEIYDYKEEPFRVELDNTAELIEIISSMLDE